MSGGLNLHDIVRKAITFVNPDETVLWYQSIGEINNLGVIKPLYAAPVEVEVQWQPQDSEQLRQVERVSDTKNDWTVFMYSGEDAEVSGIKRRPVPRTGDFLYRDGEWYLITAVTKDWTKRGWTNCTAVLQYTPPDFSACDWYKK